MFAGQAGCVYQDAKLVGHILSVYGVIRAWRLENLEREVKIGFSSTAAAREWIEAREK